MMQVRLAKARDIDTMVLLDFEANLTHWTKSEYLGSLNNSLHRLYVLETPNGEIIGVAVLSVVDFEAEVLQFVVKRSFQKNGYGRILLQQIFKILTMQQVRQIFLEVRENNIAAISLYQSCGFAIVGRRANYYKVDNWHFDAMVMLRNL